MSSWNGQLELPTCEKTNYLSESTKLTSEVSSLDTVAFVSQVLGSKNRAAEFSVFWRVIFQPSC
jgi:hypothetical protein